jgi:hypothetical protein
MKLVLFKGGATGEPVPGLLTDRGVVSVASAVTKSHTPQLTMQGIIDGFDGLRPALERLAKSGEAQPLAREAAAAAAPRQNLCCTRQLLGTQRRRGRSTCS